ncbi:MAG: signal recognition particle-docking protein FtsY [Acidimicrobiia bacterium]
MLVVVLVLIVAVPLLLRRRSGPDVVVAPTPAPAMSGLGGTLRRVWGAGPDETTWERLEEALLAADVGVDTAERVIAGIRASQPADFEEARDGMAELLVAEMAGRDRSLHLDGSPATVLVVGVNGTGKTTTIAKLASRLMGEGRSVMLAAADTFRAAAGEQLQVWADRVGSPVVVGQRGGDPAAVAFDAVSSARAQGIDVVLIDSAGRLHDRRDLMAELAKIHRVVGGESGVAETLLVIDATSGQNVVSQVRVFTEAVPVTGLVLTKMEGTARGGVVVTVEQELDVPVKLIGVGERLDDLAPFEPRSFVTSLLET